MERPGKNWVGASRSQSDEMGLKNLQDQGGLTRYSLNAPTEVVKQIIINIEAGVEVEVTIAA